MTARRYRAVDETGAAYHEPGEFERDWSAAEEKDWLDSGWVELVPRTYRVLSSNYERPQGSTFEAVLARDIEAALVAGGHIELVNEEDTKPPNKSATKAEWVEHAVKWRGADRAEAEAMTKDDLVATYGDDDLTER